MSDTMRRSQEANAAKKPRSLEANQLKAEEGQEARKFPRGPSETNVVAELRAPRPWPAMVQTVQQRETALQER